MKKIIMVIIFFIYSINLSAQIQVSLEYIKRIPNGINDGELLYISQPGWKQGPSDFTISNDKLLYVDDTINNRIVIFDLNINFIKTIINFNKYDYGIEFSTSTSNSIIVDTDNFLYIYRKPAGLIVFNANGTEKFFIKREEMNVSTLFFDSLFIINKKIFFLNDNTLKLGVINENGYVIKNENERVNIINNFSIVNTDLITFSVEEQKEFNDLLKSMNSVFYLNKIYTTSFSKFLKFITFFQKHMNTLNTSNMRDINNVSDEIFLGWDSHLNYYWRGIINNKNYIIIYNKYLSLITFIELKGHLLSSVAPNGDIYLMESNSDGTTFYRIRNTWDPISESAPVTPKVISLNATSFIDYKNMYTPRMLFDNKPETAWLEGKKDAGIGESVTLTLDTAMTIDRLVIAPGYFDAKWWKANNRIKKLLIELDSYKKEAVFKNEMVMQDVVLDKSISFKKAKFTILEVYSSGKDNDTAISDISFFNSGKKIEPDMGGIK